MLPTDSQGPGQPCAAARHLTDLDDVETDTVFWTARHAFDDAWMCTPRDAPFLMYGDVQVSYKPGADDGSDKTLRLEKLRRTKGGDVVEIQGRPAWVGAGDESSGVYTHGLMYVDDTEVLLLAPADVPLEDLVDVANDLDLPPVG